jgi:hypothetical protein
MCFPIVVAGCRVLIIVWTPMRVKDSEESGSACSAGPAFAIDPDGNNLEAVCHAAA